MRDRTEADDIVQGAANRALLDLILPPARIAAKKVGYAITVHGSLNRDIDLVAVPWREGAVGIDGLSKAVSGAIAGVTGSCLEHDEWTDKPHGRKARTLLVYCGQTHMDVDLSVMPTRPATLTIEEKDDA
jgi:hypothetical protein